jgi:Spy/CpxP family protein refolding chaperone
MQNKWIKVIFVASLAFNLAFVATALYRILDSHPQKHAKSFCQKEFKLKKEQKEEIKKIIKQFKINLSEYKQDILDKRISIIEAMSDTEFNLEDIEKKTEELNQLENQLNVQFVDVLIRINAILEAEQRLNFLYKLSQNWFFSKKVKR